MIVEIQGFTETYVISTDSLERPGNTIHLTVRPDEPISEIVRRLNEARGRPQ